MAVELHDARQPGRVGRSGLAMGLGKAVGGLGIGGFFGGAGGEGKTRIKTARAMAFMAWAPLPLVLSPAPRRG